jgi:hypothetical protein
MTPEDLANIQRQKEENDGVPDNHLDSEATF